MDKRNYSYICLIIAHLLLAVLVAVFSFAGITKSRAALQRQMTEVAAGFSLDQEKAQDEDPAGEDVHAAEDEEDEEAEDDPDLRSKASGLRDGEYTGTGQGYGGQITMKLIVEQGAVKSLEIVSASGETPAYLNMARSIIPKIISSGNANVDGVSGATYSSNGIKAASAQAIKKAGGDGSVDLKKAAPKQKGKDGKKSKKRSYKKPEGGWKDGTYTGSARGYGGAVSVKVTIKGGKIKSISASGKHETSSYWRRAQAVKGRIIRKQNPRVDAVSGATYSSNGIINAVISALNKAGKSGRKDQVIRTADDDWVLDEGETARLRARAKTKLTYKSSAPGIAKVDRSGRITGISEGKASISITAVKTKKYKKAVKKVTVTVFAKDTDEPADTDDPGSQDDPEKALINGTFTGASDGYGGQVTASVVIESGVIKSITVDGPSETWKYWSKAKKIITKMVSGQTWDVDAVSGATLSSNGIRYAVKQALESAGLI